MEIIEKSFHPYCVRKRMAIGVSADQWALLLWDVFRSHLTKAVRELLKARRIQPAYVPPNYTHSLSPPDQFVQKELKEGNASQFQVWYGEEINRQIDSGVPEEEVWVDFTLSNMKSLHAKWTINSYEAMRGRKDLLQRAWEATGLWSILQRTFQPTANVPRAYEEPTSDNEEPPYASESEYTTEDSEADLEGGYSDETESDNGQGPMPVTPASKKRRLKNFVVYESSDEDANTKCAASPPKRRQTAVSRAIDKEEAELAMAITQSLQQASVPSETPPGIMMTSDRADGEEDDDDKVVVVEARMCLDANWICIFTDYQWQQQALSIFGSGCPPIRGKFGVKQPIKCTRTQAPLRVRPIEGDGNCLFRCLSYLVWRDESHHDIIRESIVNHLSTVWHLPRIQYSAKTWYLHKTNQEKYIQLRMYNLTVQEYLDASKMNENKTYGGSTELETAAHLFKTPIYVYFEGNPCAPACSWVVYGTEYVTNTTKCIALNWRLGNHFEVVNKI